MKADIIVKSIIFNRNLNRILLLQRSGNDPTGANTWEGVGGNIECGECLEEAIKREIREETGITDVKTKRIAYVTLAGGQKPYCIIAYLCESKTEAVVLSDEHQAFLWANEDDCKNMLPRAILDDFEKNKIWELFHAPSPHHKTAIITGASSGIGAAITKELLLLGYKVFGFGRNFTPLLAGLAADDAFAPLLSYFTPVSLDLTKTGILAEKIREIKKSNPVSLLVNNAGAGYFGLHEELKPAMIHEMVTVNLEVPMLLCQLLLRDLKETNGHIIQISSVTAKKSSPHGCAYGATKAGLTAFSGSLFDEARKYGIHVSCIHPDMTKSNFYRNADFTADEEPGCSLAPEDVAAAVRAILTAREGMVVSDITLTPQKHRIAKRARAKEE